MKRQSNKHTQKRSSASTGTAILGRVIPELTVCGVFNVSEGDASFIAKGISTAILAQFQMDILHASGLLGIQEEE